MANLKDILATEELDRRPDRAPDYAGEAKALAQLATAMSDDPDAVLQRLSDLIVDLGLAESAGVSLLEEHEGTFRWPAVSGAWGRFVEGRMPIDASPCGVVIQRDTTLLFREPHRFFPAARIDPLIHEVLLVPFHIAGKPAGTVWAIAHDPARQFQREDARLLSSLAHFASAAVQAHESRRLAEAARDMAAAARTKSDARLQEELADARLLQDLSASLTGAQDTSQLYERILDSAMALMKADAASIQTIDPDGDSLRLTATRNYHPDSVAYWQSVGSESRSACGQALRLGRRVVIPDTEDDPGMAGTRDLDHFRLCGLRAVQSTPLATLSGRPIGMLSTLWRLPRRPSHEDFALFDALARQTADLIALAHSNAELRESEARYRLLFDSIDEGFCIIEVLFDDADKAVDYRFLQINPAFVRQTGLTDAVGKKMRDLAPAHEQHWFDICGRIALTGTPERFEERAEALGHWYEVYAFRIGRPEDRRVAILFKDILQRKLMEQTLRERQERQAFMLGLSDAMRAQPDGGMMAKTALSLLARHLGLDRAYITTVHADQDRATISEQYHRGDLAPLPAGQRLSDFPEGFRHTPAGGLVVRDRQKDGTLSQQDRQSLAAIGLGAFVVVSVRKDARDLSWTLVAAMEQPRDWTAGDIALVQDAAERIWTATERNRAEIARRESDERFLQFAEASRDVIWFRNAASLQWEYLNPAFEMIYGLRRGEVLEKRGRHWAALIHPEDRSHATAQLERVAAGEWATFEYRIIRPSDGGMRWLRTTAFPMKDENGHVGRIGGVAQDVTHLKRAEAVLAEAESRQRALLEGIAQMIWRATESGDWTWSSTQWSAYTGQTPAMSSGLGWLEAYHPEDRASARQSWEKAAETGRYEHEGRIRDAASGEYRWFAARARPLRDGSGAVVEWLGTSTDIDELRRLQDQQAVLVAELQHRTRNLMAVIRSVSEKTARASRDLAEFRIDFKDRLEALARVQGLLSRLKEHDRVTFDQLIETELSAMDGGSDRITTSGPLGVRLRSSTVQTLAMALHELATNAVKYGALAQPSGCLAISWRFDPAGEDGQPWLHLDWHETGVNMNDAPPQELGGGQGRELIEQALPYQLNARTTYLLGPEGVHCTISFPISGKSNPAGQALR